jgi:protease I
MGLFTSKTGKLKGMRIAILATEGVEQVELTRPRKAIEKAGAIVELVSPKAGIKSGRIKCWNLTDWGDSIKVDCELAAARTSRYDALVLPGGVLNPDRLRTDTHAVDFVRSFFDTGRPVAAICHGPWTLIEADVVRGRTLTSWPSLKTDLRNAGATWVNEEVVEDRGLITSRNPADLPAFIKHILDAFHKAHTQPQAA